MQEKLLSTKELSEYLGIAVSTIIEYRMNNKGGMFAPNVKICINLLKYKRFFVQ